MEHFYLYRITNQVNGKIYVGVHKTKRLDDGYMGSGKVILAAIAKHGVENFHKEILETFDDAAQMFEREKEVVTEEFLARDDTYNLRRGGTGGFDYINSKGLRTDISIPTQARVRLMSENVEFRRRHSVKSRETRQRLLSEGRGPKNFKCPEFQKEMTRRAAESNRGRKRPEGISKKERNSQFGSFWITNGLENRKTRETIPEGWFRGRSMGC